MSAEAAKERLVQAAVDTGRVREAEAVVDALLAHGDDLLVALGGNEMCLVPYESVNLPPDREAWDFPRLVSQEQST